MILIGTENSKRTDYMQRAAAMENLPLELLTWDTLIDGDYQIRQLHGAAVKIDPPPSQTFHLEQMNNILKKYKVSLGELSKATCRFLNTPEAIYRLLDKRDTKKHLMEKEIPVTEMFPKEVSRSEELLELMERKHCYSVFIKPRFFSGAAGVAALRFHPARKKFCLYSSCRQVENHLINTKKLFRTENPREILPLLDRLLALDCILERWHPKADFNGKSYDLRVVFQFGHIAHMVARQSSGPITNLHLNNQALPVNTLGLDLNTLNQIEAVCAQALSAFPGLSMAGIDILLEKGTLRPRIIEMNGQGDLIYQDIYDKNLIYREQAKWLYGHTI